MTAYEYRWVNENAYDGHNIRTLGLEGWRVVPGIRTEPDDITGYRCLLMERVVER
jgi:hypothetical protein